MPEPMVLVDAAVRTPPDREFWTNEGMVDLERYRPTWTQREVAETFFGISKASMVRHFAAGYNDCPSTGLIELPRRPTGMRIYIWRLWDIERMAHSMTYHGAISVQRLNRAVLIVKTVAEQYGYL